MSEAALKCATQEIVVDDVLPHAPETIWKTLTTGELIGRWLMQPTGFAPVKGTRFTFQTTPAGAWDGVVIASCLRSRAASVCSYSWQGGRDSNAHYGSRLDTVVTWTLARGDGGSTRLRLVHSGFVTPRNDAAFKNMSEGWKRVVGRIGVFSGEQ
jgi:uncharacterized protein YndB with AHSA1/START domain